MNLQANNPIYMFVKGTDKKLRDAMVNTFNSMMKTYNKLYEKNYKGISDSNYPKQAIELIVATSIFYRYIYLPLENGIKLVKRINKQYKSNVKFGKTSKKSIDTNEYDKLLRAFYAITKKYNLEPQFFSFTEIPDMIKRINNYE